MLTKKVKKKYVQRALKHKEADSFIQGDYWNGKQGCCVGCLAEVYENPHAFLAEELSTPEWMFQLADCIHEALEEKHMREWPVKFMQALPVEVSEQDFDKKIKTPFLLSVLKDLEGAEKSIRTINGKRKRGIEIKL